MLLSRNNDILLSDFGIALVAQSSRYQNTQDVVGTIAYMSPEQIQGKPRPASDQYSLAVIVYEWLSGDRPFHGSFTELCAQHVFASPPPLREKMASIPRDVEQVVMTALAKDPHQRFMSVQAFANALEQACQPGKAGVTVIPPPPPAYNPRPTPTPPILPTQYIPPPPQYVITPTPPPIQRSSFSAYENYPGGGSYPSGPGSGYPYGPGSGYPAGPKPAEAAPDKQKVKVWSIGKRQIVAMLIGTILYAILRNLIIFLDFSGGSFLPNYAFIIPAIVISLFFGATFGPWVGLVTGGVGTIIDNYISNLGHYNAWVISNVPQQIYNGSLRWQVVLGYALIGFIAGLAMLGTRGRYKKTGTIVIADIISAVGVIIGISLFEVLYSPSFLPIAFPRVILPNTLFSLIFLPVLLLLYNKIVTRSKPA